MLKMKFRVLDRMGNNMHIVGANQHDTFHIWDDNQVTYYNYQTGESSLFPGEEFDDDGSGYILMRYTGKKDINGEEIYEGDILESQVGGQLLEIRYGIYQAYCPVDKAAMDSVGFYAVSAGYPDMPIGNIEEYAIKKGNIHQNPELLAYNTSKIERV